MPARWKTTTGCIIAAAAVAIILFVRPDNRPPPQAATPPKPPPITAPKLNHPTKPLGAIEAPAGTTSVRMEVCGPDGQPRTVTVTDPTMFDMSAENYDRWKMALSNSPNASAHAQGLMFQWLDAHESLAADTSLEQLIDLATTTRNPDAYAAALSLCKTGFANEATLPACRRLSLSEWTKLDPDNALPWLASAAEARNHGDSWAESVAFARASQAHRLDDYAQSSLSAALASIPPDTPRTEQLFARTRLFGIQAARTRLDIIEATQYCSKAAVEQSQVHDQCDAVAELLVEHGGNLLNFSLGRKIGERVGWPAARLEQMKREASSLRELLFSNARKPMLSCEFMEWQESFTRRTGEVGELAALRELRDRQSSQ